jgi:hypothetical protein
MTLLDTLQHHPYIGGLITDYKKVVIPFAWKVHPWYLIPAMVALKTIEFSVYRWTKES